MRKLKMYAGAVTLASTLAVGGIGCNSDAGGTSPDTPVGSVNLVYPFTGAPTPTSDIVVPVGQEMILRINADGTTVKANDLVYQFQWVDDAGKAFQWVNATGMQVDSITIDPANWDLFSPFEVSYRWTPPSAFAGQRLYFQATVRTAQGTVVGGKALKSMAHIVFEGQAAAAGPAAN